MRLEAERIAPLTGTDVADLCASFQAAVVDVVVDRTRVALAAVPRARPASPAPWSWPAASPPTRRVRRALQRLAVEAGLRLAAPPPELCTDNGAMIAWAGIERLRRGMIDDLRFAPRARWPLALAAGAA